MTLKKIIKYLKDMELLYDNAVVCVRDKNQEYRIISVEGFMGEKRERECKDSNVVIINVRGDDDD